MLSLVKNTGRIDGTGPRRDESPGIRHSHLDKVWVVYGRVRLGQPVGSLFHRNISPMTPPKQTVFCCKMLIISPKK